VADNADEARTLAIEYIEDLYGDTIVGWDIDEVRTSGI
jgi:hypothetical protein